MKKDNYILYSVYHDLELEERSHEVFLALEQIPDTSVIVNSLGSLPEKEKEHAKLFVPKKIKHLGMLRLFAFWKLSKKLIKKYNPSIVVVHDDAVLVRYIKRNYPGIKIIYDQSELEIDRKVTGVKTLFLKFCDLYGKRAVKKCDLFIAANKERAEISKKFFGFDYDYIVFNNMHKIDEKDIGTEFYDNYSNIFDTRKKVITYGGGIAADRGTFDLIDAVKGDDSKYLIVAGSAWNNLPQFETKLKQENIDNVLYVGYVSRREWAYILSKSSASVVFYDKKISMNFKYCASGKGYESLFLGVPIICSDNPPLVSLCNEYQCGISDMNMRVATEKLFDNYEYYKKNAEQFESLVDYDARIPELTKAIIQKLSVEEV